MRRRAATEDSPLSNLRGHLEPAAVFAGEERIGRGVVERFVYRRRR